MLNSTNAPGSLITYIGKNNSEAFYKKLFGLLYNSRFRFHFATLITIVTKPLFSTISRLSQLNK